MKFTMMQKVESTGVNNRRLSAARRAIRRENDKFPLLPEFQVTETPEERILRFDRQFEFNKKNNRKKIAIAWRKARALLYSRPDKIEILKLWNSKIYPLHPEYFLDLIRHIEKEPGYLARRRNEIDKARFTGELMRKVLSMEKINETIDYKTAFFNRLTRAKKRFDEIANTEGGRK
jgi:hypothetical protein